MELVISVVAFQRKIALVLGVVALEVIGVVGLEVVIFVVVIDEVSRIFKIQL